MPGKRKGSGGIFPSPSESFIDDESIPASVVENPRPVRAVMTDVEIMVARMTTANPEWAPIGMSRDELIGDALGDHTHGSDAATDLGGPRAAAAVGASASLGAPVFAIHHPVDGGCSCRKNCGNAGKHPATRNGFHDATSDPDEITRMWGGRPYNIGVPTGITFDVLDIDHTDLAVGIADLPACVAELVETAPMVRSGGGKFHVYFEPTGLGRHIRFSKHCDWLGTDGYAIIPPSITTGTYAWIRPIDGPLPKVPVELLDMIRRPAASSRCRTTSRPIGERLDETSFYGLYGRLAVAREGTRNDVLNWAAHKIGTDVYQRKATPDQGDMACEQLEYVALLIGLEPHEVESTIMSGYSAGLAGS